MMKHFILSLLCLYVRSSLSFQVNLPSGRNTNTITSSITPASELKATAPVQTRSDQAQSILESPARSTIPSSYHSIHLISLPPLHPEESPKLIRDLWKWKDVVLGDGRDYFIPRPRALKALSDILIGSQVVECDESLLMMTHTIEECCILSNCARMEILLSLQTATSTATSTDTSTATIQSKDEIDKAANHAAQLMVSNCLLNQLSLYQSTRNEKGSTATLWEGLSSFLDLPGMVIDESKSINDETVKTKTSYSKEILLTTSQHLSNLLQSKYQTQEIINHFCLIASGLAKRDSRPNRAITFRPFSSRDAHVMLQIKRTVEISCRYPRMKIILDTALNAGKSARDVNKVPILHKLKGYDCEGKYSTSAPAKLLKDAVEDVKEIAIKPAVENCMKKLKAYDNSNRIASFTKRVDQLVLEMDDGDNNVGGSRQFIKQITHETIMKLRDGDDIDLDSVIRQIEMKLP